MKKYFNRSIFFMVVAFIIYFASEVILDLKETFYSNQTAWNVWSITTSVKNFINITVLVFLALFMKNANEGSLFSSRSNKLWSYKSVLLLVNGIIGFIEIRFNNSDSLPFASYIFLSSFCYAMSAIFKEAESLQQENDLTI